MSKVKPVTSNVYIDFSILKEAVIDIVRRTPGIAEVNGFLVKTINSTNDPNRVIDITELEPGLIQISFSIALFTPFLIVDLPMDLQDKIYYAVKQIADLDSKINILVTNIINLD